MLQSTGSQRVRHDLATEQQQPYSKFSYIRKITNCHVSIWVSRISSSLQILCPYRTQHLPHKLEIKSALSFSKLNHHYSLQCVHLLSICPLPGTTDDSRDAELKESL